MKRMIYLLLMFLLSVVAISAQSLLDNPDYKKSLEYKTLYQKAMNDGDYEKALEYADLASEHAKKSEEYVNSMIVRFRANQAIDRLKSRLAEVKRFGGDKTYPEEFGLATEAYAQAASLYKEGDYQGSLDQSNEALNLLAAVKRTPGSSDVLPSEYVVRYLPANRDCLWKIAGYDFVYGDPTLWPLLYKANKAKFPEPENPNLILPGMILTIPERANEKRSGIWKDGSVK